MKNNISNKDMMNLFDSLRHERKYIDEKVKEQTVEHAENLERIVTTLFYNKKIQYNESTHECMGQKMITKHFKIGNMEFSTYRKEANRINDITEEIYEMDNAEKQENIIDYMCKEYNKIQIRRKQEVDEKNNRQYQQYLSCGYEKPMELDQYGWCKNEIQVEEMEQIDIFRKNTDFGYIQIVQIPNGNWIACGNFNCNTYGFFGRPNVWMRQHKTKYEAIKAELDNMLDHIDERDRTKKSFIIEAINEAKRKYYHDSVAIDMFENQ